MTLKEITDCFPSIKDWEDSYLENGRQRLLGRNDNDKFFVEIILEDEINKVAFLLDQIHLEILTCLNLFTRDQNISLKYLGDASEFARDNPNTPYQKTFHDYEVRMSRIRAEDGATYSLIIKLAGYPE